MLVELLMILVFAGGLAAAEKTGGSNAAPKEKRSFWAFAWSELKEDARLTWIGMKSGIYTCGNILTGDIVGASVEVAGVVGKVAEEYTGESNPLSEAVGHGKAGLIIIGTRVISDYTGNEKIAKLGEAGAAVWELTDATKLFKNGGIKQRNLKLLVDRGAIPLVGETNRVGEIRTAVVQIGTIAVEGADLVFRGLSESDAKNSTVNVTQEGDIITVTNKTNGETLKISRQVLEVIQKTYQEEMQKKRNSESVEDRLPMKAPGQTGSSGKTSGKPVTLDKIEIVR